MSNDLELKQTDRDAWRILAFIGRMDALSAPTADEVGQAALQTNLQVVLDMSELTYVSSAGLRVIMRMLKKSKSMGKDLAIAGASGTVMDMLEYSGMDVLFKMYKSLDELE